MTVQVSQVRSLIYMNLKCHKCHYRHRCHRVNRRNSNQSDLCHAERRELFAAKANRKVCSLWKEQGGSVSALRKSVRTRFD